jgi:tetratricopeptide (TPR) repeat protein
MSGPFEAEIRKHVEALAADPKSRAFVPLADIYRKLGRYEEALSVAKEGLSHHPHYLGGKMALARVCFEYGDLDPAGELLEEILTFAPDNLLGNRLLAQIHLLQNDPGKARPLVRQLLLLDPNDPWAKRQSTFLEKEVPPPAPVISTMVESPPVEPTIVEEKSTPPVPTRTVTLAELYRSQGHDDRALEIYRELLRSDPGNPSLVRAVGELERGREEVPGLSSLRRGALLETLLGRIRERRREVA